MKYSRFIAILFCVLFLGSTILVSCGGGGGGGGEDEADPLNIVATWLLQPVGYEAISPITMKITAHRAPDDIDAWANPEAGDLYIADITVTTTFDPGVVSPRYLTIVITFNDGLVLTLTGSVNANNTSMSGDYTDTSGSSDTWSAARQ